MIPTIIFYIKITWILFSIYRQLYFVGGFQIYVSVLCGVELRFLIHFFPRSSKKPNVIAVNTLL